MIKISPLSLSLFSFCKNCFLDFIENNVLGAQNTHPYIWAFNNYFYTAIEMTVFQFNINAIWAWLKLYYLWQSSLHHGLMGSRIYVNGGSTQFSFTKILSKQLYITCSRVVHIIWVNIFLEMFFFYKIIEFSIIISHINRKIILKILRKRQIITINFINKIPWLKFANFFSDFSCNKQRFP